MPAKTVRWLSPPRLSVSFSSFCAPHVFGGDDPDHAQIDLGKLDRN